MIARLLQLLCPLAIAACASEPPAEPATDAPDPCASLETYGGPAAVTLGAGYDRFAPISDGSDIVFEWGPGGGLMSALGIETKAIFPGTAAEIEAYFGDGPRTGSTYAHAPVTSYVVSSDDGVVLATSKVRLPLAPDGSIHASTTHTRIGDPILIPDVFLLSSPISASLAVTIEDACGSVASRQHGVRLIGPSP